MSSGGTTCPLRPRSRKRARPDLVRSLPSVMTRGRADLLSTRPLARIPLLHSDPRLRLCGRRAPASQNDTDAEQHGNQCGKRPWRGSRHLVDDRKSHGHVVDVDRAGLRRCASTDLLDKCRRSQSRHRRERRTCLRGCRRPKRWLGASPSRQRESRHDRCAIRWDRPPRGCPPAPRYPAG